MGLSVHVMSGTVVSALPGVGILSWDGSSTLLDPHLYPDLCGELHGLFVLHGEYVLSSARANKGYKGLHGLGLYSGVPSLSWVQGWSLSLLQGVSTRVLLLTVLVFKVGMVILVG
jgi:hypothetical protein